MCINPMKLELMVPDPDKRGFELRTLELVVVVERGISSRIQRNLNFHGSQDNNITPRH